MSLLSFTRRAAVCFCWGVVLALPAAVLGQTNYYATNGTEYGIIGSLPGDQVWPDAAVTPTGGFVVWQDNITDGSGWGVSAQRLDSTLSGTLSTFRVNVQGTNDQENPRVAMLKNGGAVFVWQGGLKGYQHIYARFLSPTNTFLTTNDILVNTFTNNFRLIPPWRCSTTATWWSCGAVLMRPAPTVCRMFMARFFRRQGRQIGGEFLINQFTAYNQRTPTVAALANGGFAVAWVSEQERSSAPDWATNSPFITDGLGPDAERGHLRAALRQQRRGAKRRVSGQYRFRSLRQSRRGGGVGWQLHGRVGGVTCVATNGWDIYARPFSSAGTGGTAVRVNTLLARRPIRAAHQRHWRGLSDCLDEFVGRTARAKACMGSLCTRTARWWAANFA